MSYNTSAESSNVELRSRVFGGTVRVMIRCPVPSKEISGVIVTKRPPLFFLPSRPDSLGFTRQMNAHPKLQGPTSVQQRRGFGKSRIVEATTNKHYSSIPSFISTTPTFVIVICDRQRGNKIYLLPSPNVSSPRSQTVQMS